MLEPPTMEAIAAAARRLEGLALRTPLVRLEGGRPPREIYLKLENLQPVGSFKIRGAGNAMRAVPVAALKDGVFTASAGNMAHGLAYVAKRLGVRCSAVVPDHAPAAKLGPVERLGAEIFRVPFPEWWRVLETRSFDRLRGRFVHPVSDPAVMAGNGTIGLEIAADLPDVDTVIVPYGGGGLSCGIAAALRGLRPGTRIFAAEVETAAPLAPSLAAGRPVAVEYTPSFVDGIGGQGVLAEMWPLARTLLDGSIVVTLNEIAAAIRTLLEAHRVVAEGAGAAALAAALARPDLGRRVVCVVSGGNIDLDRLTTILAATGA